jgi:hypothetical protein
MNRRKLLIGLGAAAGAGGVLGSGAFTSVTANRTAKVEVVDDASAYLALESTSEPNGAYADGSGDQLELDFSSDNETDKGGKGLGDDSVYTFDDVFKITNQGTQGVGVTATVFGVKAHSDISRFELYSSDADNNEEQQFSVSDPDVQNPPTPSQDELVVRLSAAAEDYDDSNDSTIDLGVGNTLEVGVEIDTGSGSGGGASPPTADYFVVTDPNNQEPQFASLQAAVDEANSGEIIQIEAGLQNESVTVDTGDLTISGSTQPELNNFTINLKADGITLKDLLFVDFEKRALKLGDEDNTASRATIEGCRFEYTQNERYETGGSTQAMLIQGDSGKVTVEDCTIRDIVGKDDGGDNSVQGILVGFEGNADLTVRNTMIEGITSKGHLAYGVQVREGSTLTVEDSTIRDISGGTRLGPTDDDTILDIFDSPDDNYAATGITANDAASIDVRGTDFGVLPEGEDNATQVGISVGSVSGSFNAENNNFEVPVGIQDQQNAEPLDARRCWWDSEAGPTPLAKVEEEDLPLAVATSVRSTTYPGSTTATRRATPSPNLRSPSELERRRDSETPVVPRPFDSTGA